MNSLQKVNVRLLLIRLQRLIADADDFFCIDTEVENFLREYQTFRINDFVVSWEHEGQLKIGIQPYLGLDWIMLRVTIM